MNCFAHAYRFLEASPYFIVGTALPDWLTLIDRRVRARKKTVAPFADDQDEITRQLARGIIQHHVDDDWFHNRRLFVELNLKFSVQLRELLAADAGFRPHLVGHIVIEMLLDGYLNNKYQGLLDAYYTKIAGVDPVRVQRTLRRMTHGESTKIARFIPRFIEEGYLYDYVDDNRVLYRMNRVLQRVKLVPLPDTFLMWLPGARESVYEHAEDLLTIPS